MVNEPFMDPQINIQVSNPMLSNYPTNKDENERCLSWRTFLICLGTCIGTNAAMCGLSFCVFLIIGLAIVASGGLGFSSGDDE